MNAEQPLIAVTTTASYKAQPAKEEVLHAGGTLEPSRKHGSSSKSSEPVKGHRWLLCCPFS